MKKHSFRKLFLVYSAFYLLIISGMVGLAGYYLFQSQKNEVLNRVSKLKDSVNEHLQREINQAGRSLRVLRTGFEVFAVDSSQQSINYFSQLISQLIQERDVQYNAYFALEKPWAQKYFGRDGYILTTHRDSHYYGTPEFYSPKTFIKSIFTDPKYQKDPSEIWYQSAKISEQIEITEPYFDKTYMQQWLITASLGIYEKGKFQGMVGIDILVDELTKAMGKFELANTGGVLWIDKRKDQILSQSSARLEKFMGHTDRFKKPMLNSAQDIEVWQKILNASGEIDDIVSVNGNRYIISANSIPNSPWMIVVYQEYWEAFSPVFEKFYRICLVGLLGLLLLVQLAVHVHSSVALPMENLIDSIKAAIRSSRENKFVHYRDSIAASGYMELHRVSKLFNVLLRIIDRNTKKQFDIIESERVKALHQAKMASLGQMASGIAHEINNPLSILNGRLVKAEKFLRATPPDVESATATVRSIEQIVFRIAKIVRGLRHFSREASKDPFELKSLREIIEETLDLCSQRFQNHGIRVHTTELEEDVIIECQTVQISQVLLNLLNNSFDAIMDLTEKWVRVDVQDFEDSVVIRVTDSGKGISGEIRERIMDPFFTTKEVGKGTGLGLSLSRGIIEYHQGQLFLDVESENTSFVIKLPKFRNYKLKTVETKLPDWE